MSMSRQLLVSKYLEETRKVERPDKIRIRAFRAIDDLPSCVRFHQGHTLVLESYGLKLTTANPTWMEDPFTYVILVESLDSTQSYGGSRIQISTKEIPLPMEAAIGYMEPRIYDMVAGLREQGTAEICGLWNSSVVAGMGIGSTYSIRCAFAYAAKLNVKSMFALCSPYTYRMAGSFGFNRVKSLGKDGVLPYPSEKQVAIVTFQDDVQAMNGASEIEKTFIFNLRNTPTQITEEDVGKSNPIQVHYNL
ncbi:MAG: hypothetical protein ACOVQ5_01310 [Flavobacteriales bacterium]|jgi:hypothetical protein